MCLKITYYRYFVNKTCLLEIKIDPRLKVPVQRLFWSKALGGLLEEICSLQKRYLFRKVLFT